MKSRRGKQVDSNSCWGKDYKISSLEIIPSPYYNLLDDQYMTSCETTMKS